MRLIVRTVAVVALGALAGCHLVGSGESCNEPQNYETATSIAPLHAAEGLPAANTKNALKVPEASAEAKPRKPTDACLDRAPAFYADRPKPAAPTK
ncbi:MAG TPA: hypothetical protein VMU00_12630 [Steroidobacteraceae bacterium]|nr:hypothetical protein [Steroidobacteraceae bacterium]